MTKSLLQERLQRVVNVVFGGSSHAAARVASVEPSTLYRLLEGSVSDPRMATVRALAEAFGLPLAWLTGDISTTEAQRGESNLPEEYWLLQEFHGRRRRLARRGVRATSSAPTNRVAERFAGTHHLQGAYPLRPSDFLTLLESLPLDDPSRLSFERRFAELETELVEAVSGRSFATPRPTRHPKRNEMR